MCSESFRAGSSTLAVAWKTERPLQPRFLNGLPFLDSLGYSHLKPGKRSRPSLAAWPSSRPSNLEGISDLASQGWKLDRTAVALTLRPKGTVTCMACPSCTPHGPLHNPTISPPGPNTVCIVS